MTNNGNASAAAESAGQFTVTPVMRPREQVETQLRGAILSGLFRDGNRLPSETKLAEQFKVSRATIREALRGLAEGGLISKIPGANGGSFVTYFDHHMLGDVVSDRLSNTLELGSISYDEVAAFRNLLEVPAARLAATNRTQEHLDGLHDVIEREKHASVSDPEVPMFNAEFHRIIAEATGNRLLASFVSALHRVTHPLAFIDTSPELGKQAVLHHIAIVSAVAACDPDRAAKSMEEHLDYLRDHVAHA